MIKVLFICMGNICRSPTAHGVFEKLLEDEGLSHVVEVDSAGTHAYHVGEAPDRRATETALRRGVRLDHLRARKVHIDDFALFDYVLAMDEENLANLRRLCPPQYGDRVRLFLDFADDAPTREVPDPYYGGQSGFDFVLDLVESASVGLLADIKRRF